MRERQMVLDGSPCDTNFYSDGPNTVAEARRLGRQMCPHADKCSRGFLHPVREHQCVMQAGLVVAQWTIKERHGVAKEMEDFKREAPRPTKGWIWSPDREQFLIITDRAEMFKKVREFAELALRGREESKPAESTRDRMRREVGPTFADVVAHAMTPVGIDLRKIEELEGRFGYNAGKGCDVRRGPCSCGAWH